MIVESMFEGGVCCLCNSGKKVIINFNECNKNWLSYRKRLEHLSDEQMEIITKHDKTVGQRDIRNNSRCIEFFTKPFTKIEFSFPEKISEYEKLRDFIHEQGWSTIDLS